jgi:hypothetical protein
MPPNETQNKNSNAVNDSEILVSKDFFLLKTSLSLGVIKSFLTL